MMISQRREPFGEKKKNRRLLTALETVVVVAAAGPVAKMLCLGDEVVRERLAEHGHTEDIVAAGDETDLAELGVLLVQVLCVKERERECVCVCVCE
jgi:hypothetical protein